MKHHLILSAILFISLFTYSQEICTNGIDDDGDGLIDLNDPNCNCHTFSETPSIIPNPSFEDYYYCPTTWSQMDAMHNWIQATDATTDYYNANTSCYYVPPGFPTNLSNIPNGTGFVGAYYIDDWREYVGAALPTSLHAGTTYRLQLNVAGLVFGNGISGNNRHLDSG